MQLDLGNNIRQLRRRDKRTQEALAEALGVTSQAVSRWESGGSYPDMNLIPSIANYFGVSIDELFGYTNDRTKRIDELVTQIYDIIRQNNGVDNNISECIAIARNALVEFPGNEKLMLSLASVLYTAGYVRYGECHLIDEEGYSVYDTEKHKAYEEWREAIPLYEKVLETLPNGSLRDRAVEELSQLYVNVGSYDKSLSLAESAPKMWNSRELLRIYACDGKQQAKAMGEALLHTVNSCAALIIHTTMAYQNHMTAGEKAQAVLSAIKLFDHVCIDGNYGEFYSFLSHMYMLHSLYLWLDGKHDEAFDDLDRALELYKKFEEVCRLKKAYYTAPLVQLVKVDLTNYQIPDPSDPSTTSASLPEDWPWWTVPEVEQVKAEMQADPRWDAWVLRTQL